MSEDNVPPGDEPAASDQPAAPHATGSTGTPEAERPSLPLQEAVGGSGLPQRAPEPPITPPPTPPEPPLPPASPGRPPGERYPMEFEVEYAERLSRLKTFFRGILIIPVYLFGYLLGYLPFVAIVSARMTIFCRRKYPRWLFAAAAGYQAWWSRFVAYGLLLTDRYPSFDQEARGPVRLEYDDPPQGQLSRWRGLFWRFALLTPHLIVLWFLWLAVVVVTLLASFAILFTGRYPRGMFGFTTGVMRWTNRVWGYLLQFNDRFPPFALSADAGPAANATTVVSGTIGLLLVGGFTALMVTGATIIITEDPYVASANYAELSRGRSPVAIRYETPGNGVITVTMSRIYDPGDDLARVITPPTGSRLVVFEWTVRNRGSSGARFTSGGTTLRLEAAGKERTAKAALVTVGDAAAPGAIDEGTTGPVRAVFVVEEGEEAVSLRLHPDFGRRAGIKYEFR